MNAPRNAYAAAPFILVALMGSNDSLRSTQWPSEAVQMQPFVGLYKAL